MPYEIGKILIISGPQLFQAEKRHVRILFVAHCKSGLSVREVETS